MRTERPCTRRPEIDVVGHVRGALIRERLRSELGRLQSVTRQRGDCSRLVVKPLRRDDCDVQRSTAHTKGRVELDGESIERRARLGQQRSRRGKVRHYPARLWEDSSGRRS